MRPPGLRAACDPVACNLAVVTLAGTRRRHLAARPADGLGTASPVAEQLEQVGVCDVAAQQTFEHGVIDALEVALYVEWTK